MSKFARLFNKAVAFEKLAVYSDRNAFLKSLSQHFDSVTPTVKEKIDQLVKDIDVFSPHDQTIQNKLMDFSEGRSFDLDALVTTVNEAMGKIPEDGKHSTQIDNALNLIVELHKLIQAQEGMETVQPPAPGQNSQPELNKPVLPTVDKAVQDKLNKLLVPDGEIMPLNLDGTLGPLTHKAIEKFKEKYNVPGNYTLPQVLEVIKNAG